MLQINVQAGIRQAALFETPPAKSQKLKTAAFLIETKLHGPVLKNTFQYVLLLLQKNELLQKQY